MARRAFLIMAVGRKFFLYTMDFSPQLFERCWISNLHVVMCAKSYLLGNATGVVKNNPFIDYGKIVLKQVLQASLKPPTNIRDRNRMPTLSHAVFHSLYSQIYRGKPEKIKVEFIS